MKIVNEPKTTRDWALYYAAELKWPIFPVYTINDKGYCACGTGKSCSRPGKHPVTNHGFKDATTDIKKIDEWWPECDPCSYNIAAATGGELGLVVIDVDGEEGFASLPKEQVVSLQDANVIHAKTGRGDHFYFSSKTKINSKVGFLKHVDIRADGGYIIVPPSRHISGKCYEWIRPPHHGLTEVPKWVLNDKLKETTKKIFTVTEQFIPEGRRNDTLFRLASSFRAKDVSYEATHKALEIENQFRCNPPLDDKELLGVLDSVYKRYEGGSNNTHARVTGSWVHKGLTYEKCLENFDITKALRAGKYLQVLNIPVRWAVKGLIPQESITLLFAKGGMGKTTLFIALACAISEGIPFLGLETIQKPVVYVDFENSLPVLIDRIKRIGACEVLFWHPANDVSPPRLDSNEWELYKKLPAGSLIIFDTLRASQSGDENDSRQMAAVMQRLKELRDCGYTIVLLHHTPKANNQIYKGSTAIFDLSDHVLSLQKVRKGTNTEVDNDDGDPEEYCYRLGTKDKTRYDPFHIFIEFDSDRGIFVPAQNPDTQTMEDICRLMADKGTLNQSQIWELAKNELEIKSKDKFSRLLKKGEGKYWSILPGGLKNSKIYHLLSSCPAINSGDNRTTDMVSCPGVPDNSTGNSLETAVNTELSVVHGSIETTQTTGNFSCPDDMENNDAARTTDYDSKVIPFKANEPLNLDLLEIEP